MKPVRIPAWLRWAASVLVLGLAAALLWRELRALSPASLAAAIAALPASTLALSLVATAVSYACLAAYERMATQWLAPGKVPRAVAWRVGLEAQALANNIGFHAVTAVALRWRTYAEHGIDATTLARVVAAIGGCVLAGVLATVAGALAWSQALHGHAAMVALVLALVLAALALLRAHLRRRSRGAPVLAHAGRVVLVGLVEMATAILSFAVLVPVAALPAGPALVLLFVGAIALGIVSHAPGGLGVFEATILAAAAPTSRAEVLAALLVYRVVYNLLPGLLAAVSVGVAWMRRSRSRPKPQLEAG